VADLSTKFASKSQDWETPQDLFDSIDAEFHFTLDAAADEHNKKVDAYLSESQNAMEYDWNGNVCWLNPPFGGKRYKLSQWVEKSYAESLKGSTVVMLIPARTNTNWFHDICLKHGEVRFVRGRPRFSGTTHGLPQPLCIVVFKGVQRG
jgi:site-specific DNA-methyltransferase (adenine-specific)